MPHASRPFLATLMIAAGPGLLLLSACGSGATADRAKADSAKPAAGPSCVSTDSTPVGLAVLDFITKAEPLPKRFLSAAGTDSAMPDDGFKVLQDKGPTYFYSSDTVAQRKIREKLEEVGPYPSMLVVFRGKTEADNGNTVTVRLGGHYVGGDDHGKLAPTRSFEVRCDTTGWKVAASKIEAGA
ncbi:hypothetical protein [Gemmatimonas sp.]|uniref:hypothetical protein n=1 Tax=Gemmatimonas sp. TaxID=1962908 RepID=UPI0035616E99